MMKRRLRQKLEIVWCGDELRRYVPKSLDGGLGWGVYDRDKKRFLSDDEVNGLSADNLRMPANDIPMQ